MVFENDDDFGIDVYRSDIWDSVASKNKITVGLIKFNDKKAETLQGDFLGVQSNVYSEEVFDIEVNLNSYSPQALKLKKQGFEARGELFFKCYAKYDVDISSKDMIVFFDEYTYGINAGYVFRVEMQDAGLYQGQYCWKEFDIILVRTDGWEYKSQANTIALNAVKASYDDLDEDDYTVATWEVMAEAYALPERTNAEVLAKIEAMEEAISGLVFHDLEELEDLLDSLDLLVEEDYTSDSWSDLEEAVALEQTTNPMILIKIAAIEIAVSALVFAGQEALDEAKDAAALLDELNYTPETWAVLVAALSLPETSNSEVVAKTSAINDAISGLVFMNYIYTREITVDYSGKITSNLTNFPVLIKVDSSLVDSSVLLSNGDDIKFFLDEEETQPLEYEKVYYDVETGNGEFWVKIPSISSTSATTFYMKYGKNDCIDETVRTVWDENYNYVGHMQADGRDSSQHNFSASNNGSPVISASGKIGGALVANSGGYSVADTSMSSSNIPRTFECWAYLDNNEVTGDKYLVAYTGTGGPGDSYLIYSNSNPDKWKMVCKSRNPNDSEAFGTEGISTEWHHIVAVRSSASNFVIYDNGIGIATSDWSSGYDRYGYSGGPLAIGHMQSGYRFPGMLDEVRTSNIGRSEAWIKATYYSNSNNLLIFGTPHH